MTQDYKAPPDPEQQELPTVESEIIDYYNALAAQHPGQCVFHAPTEDAMNTLSPAAQAVLDAVKEIAPAPAAEIGAAALRAAADQLGEDLEFYNERVVSVSDLLTIANELDGTTTQVRTTTPQCADCGGPVGQDKGPPDGWELEDGRIVCHACCVTDFKQLVDAALMPSSGVRLSAAAGGWAT